MSKKNKKSRRSRREEKQEERVKALLKGFKRDNPQITPPQAQGKTILSYIPSPLVSAGEEPCLKCKHKNCKKENKIGGQAYIPYQIYETDNPLTQSKVFYRDPPLIHPCTGEVLRFLPDGIMETSGKDIMANLKSRGISMNEFLFTVFKETPEKFDGFWGYAPPGEGYRFNPYISIG